MRRRNDISNEPEAMRMKELKEVIKFEEEVKRLEELKRSNEDEGMNK